MMKLTVFVRVLFFKAFEYLLNFCICIYIRGEYVLNGQRPLTSFV